MSATASTSPQSDAVDTIRRGHRSVRWLALSTGCYGLYLALLGPFYALVSDGPFSSMPHAVSAVIFLPADPVYRVPIIRSLYDDYLNWSVP